MTKEKGKKFLIKKENLKNVLEIICQVTNYSVQEIMERKMMHRAVFKVQISPDEENETTWLRVRCGDVDCSGLSNCTVTFTRKNLVINNTHRAELVVDDYYTAIEFFIDIGHELTSTQETYRTKYAFKYEDAKYVICFDEWPQIDDIYFVTIITEDSVSEDEFVDICKMLKLNEYSESCDVVDVDKIYREKFGKAATDIRYVCFNRKIEF